VRALLLALTACHGGIAPRPPVAAGCPAGRIGKVTIEGASPRDVAPLAVLEGTLDDPPRIARTTEVAVDFLRARGYPHATIDVTRRAGCGVELAIAVDRGPRYRIADIELHSDATLPPGDARAALEDGLGTVNAVGGAYVADRLTRALAALVHRYRDAGWLDAAADAPRASWDETDHTVRLAIALHPGRRYKIGKLVARPSVIDALGLKGGDWFEAGTLRTALERARRRLARRLAVTLSVASERAAIDVEIK
jgi:outer membrane protein assembly factor BamA